MDEDSTNRDLDQETSMTSPEWPEKIRKGLSLTKGIVEAAEGDAA
jgi:hypothetical protein